MGSIYARGPRIQKQAEGARSKAGKWFSSVVFASGACFEGLPQFLSVLDC